MSFDSAADINLDVAGTPTVDITAYNDIRCMAGTTTPDYLINDTRSHRQAVTAGAEDYRYDESRWKLICGPAGKTVLRRTGVYLRGILCGSMIGIQSVVIWKVPRKLGLYF